MTGSRFNNIYFESFGKWNRYKWDANQVFPNQTLQSLHSWPWGWFLNWTSALAWPCSCFLTSPLERLSQVYGHRPQISRSLWSVEICWRSAALLVKKEEQVEHFHCSDLSRARRINVFAFSFAFALDLCLVFSFFSRIDCLGVNCISSSSESSTSESESETIIDSDISDDRSRKNCLIWFDLSAEVRWSVGDWIGAGGDDNGGSDGGGWRKGSDLSTSFAKISNLVCKSAITFNRACFSRSRFCFSRFWFCFSSSWIRASFSRSLSL